MGVSKDEPNGLCPEIIVIKTEQQTQNEPNDDHKAKESVDNITEIFVPNTNQNALPTIQEIDEISLSCSIIETAERLESTQSERNDNKESIKIERMFKKNKHKANNHEIIAKKLFNILMKNGDDYNLEKMFAALFGVKYSIQKTNAFLFTILELLSLI